MALAPASAFAAPELQTYHYWIRTPQTDQNCQEEALRLAKRFTQASGIKVTEAKCLGTTHLSADGHSYGMDTLDLTYLATQAPAPYTAIYGEGDSVFSPTDGNGVYATFAECLEDRHAQAALFQGQTGLVPVSVTCAPASNSFSQRYVLKIESFGVPVARLYATFFDFYGQPDEAFRKQGLDMITAAGGVIARAWDGKRVLYYSKNYLAVKLQQLFSFEDPAQCKSQLEAAHAIFVRDGATAVSVQCLPHTEELLKGLYTMEALVNDWGQLDSDFGLDSPKYYSFDECMGDRTRMLENHRSRTHSEALGGICHPAESGNGSQYLFEIFQPL